MPSFIVTYLRRERRKWGLTQRELAVLIGLKSRTQISRLEHGLCPPTARELLAFQLLFGMTAHQLFPRLAQAVEEELLRIAATLEKRLKADSTLRASRKRTLLRQIHHRAVMSSNHHHV